ncbi:hypothetical protein Taro_048041 [Colocasia esculenta]|uniref:RNase H type-1 domain-containing protein n=1 Tax=Colocasia esculenta TaxID=4460 RepID=A0A843WX24_COLES|nr:hypothetical protein [Colocasia esculenta]
MHTGQQRLVQVKWKFPPMGRLKLNTDASSRGNLGVARGGAVLRDDQGDIVFEISMSYGTLTSFHVEVLAVLDALRMCIRSSGLGPDILEMGSTSSTTMLRKGSSMPWCLWFIKQ